MSTSCFRLTGDQEIKFLFRRPVHKKSKRFIQLKQEALLREETAFARDLTIASSSVRGNIDIYQAVCSSLLISCSLFL